MPSNLDGLNVVRPPQQGPYLSDQQDLLNTPPFPDLAAQLDLWSNLAFTTDEPLSSHLNKDGSLTHDDLDEPDAKRDTESHHQQQQPQTSADFSQFLGSFGVDPFLVPPQHQQHQQIPQSSPTLAQLLSLNQQQFTALATQFAAAQQQPQELDQQQQTESASSQKQPPTKRSRARKTSISASTLSASAATSPSEAPSVNSTLQTTIHPTPPSDADADVMSVAAAEDKRRRNTAASARFRLKKKEREAALEKKAKDFETRVSELERECEALRRENGWLKGLVVGVTGAGVGPSGVQLTVAGSTTTPSSALPTNAKHGGKRKRDDEKV